MNELVVYNFSLSYCTPFV